MNIENIAAAIFAIAEGLDNLASGLREGTQGEAPAAKPAGKKAQEAPKPEPTPESDFMVDFADTKPAAPETPPKTKKDVIELYKAAVDKVGAVRVNPVISKVIETAGFASLTHVPEDRMGEIYVKAITAFQELGYAG